ncbi:MAG TPA: acyltransferase [Cyclobacteriaceae bacterium]|nr:acyltransferase [Cyclobacteriaceae bacterium]
MTVQTNRIVGLDSIRFLCAMIVLIGHFGPPIFKIDAGVATNLLKGISLLFNGPAAVIIFFVVSGFCIHLPTSNGWQMQPVPYYVRRITRIGIPALAALLLYFQLGIEIVKPSYVVLWSIICEIVYYLLYPALLRIKEQIGWIRLIIIAFLAAFVSVLVNLEAATPGSGYLALGNFTWLTGLPCWLTGCWLAENRQRFKELSSTGIWGLRILVIAAAAALQLARFKVQSAFASYSFTLNAFAVLGCLWLGFEIAFASARGSSRILESAGKWSYSLYLIHPAVPGILGMSDLPNDPQTSLMLIAISLPASYAFFLLIESPSHRLSTYLFGRLAKRKVSSE